MAQPCDDQNMDLLALRNLVAEADLILSTTALPQGRAKRCGGLLKAALQLADHLLSMSPAVSLGRKGGLKTAERGSEYFRLIAAKRKTRAGGRPKKQ